MLAKGKAKAKELNKLSGKQKFAAVVARWCSWRNFSS